MLEVGIQIVKTNKENHGIFNIFDYLFRIHV